MKNKRREKKAALQAIYDKVPRIQCQGHCHTSCGPIGMRALEADLLEAHLGHPLVPARSIDCQFLTEEGRCRIYENRPLVCRLWGVTTSMPCIYGCEREPMLSNEEALCLLQEAEDLSHGEHVVLYPSGWERSER